MAPGNPYAMIYLIGSSDALPDIGRWTVPVAFAPSGETFKANVSYPRGAVSHQRVLLLSNVGEKFPAAFAKASELRLMTSRGPIVSPVTGANKAMDAMQLCMDDKLPLWGVDVAAYRALRTPPTYLSDDAWFSTRDDVPYDARVFAKSGRVVARLDMDATGRVAGCTVVVSAGWKSLDEATCRAARQKARFHPAIGADGKPTASNMIVNIGFRALY